jgi:hypothetical protein
MILHQDRARRILLVLIVPAIGEPSACLSYRVVITLSGYEAA